MEQSNEKYIILEQIGEGAFSRVYKVLSKADGKHYAIKYLKRRYNSIEDVHQLPEIIALNTLFGHPNIIKLIDVVHNPENRILGLVLELMEINLFQFLQDKVENFTEAEALLIIFQILKALDFMHSRDFFHRDIKPENIMLNRKTLEMKLGDFGSARTNDSRPFTEYISTRWYRAPECLLTSGIYGAPMDIWAVGCVLFEALSSKPLFPGKHQLDQIGRINMIIGTPSRNFFESFSQSQKSDMKISFVERPAQNLQDLLPKTSSETLDLLNQMLKYDPDERISASDALGHICFTQFRVMEDMYLKKGLDISFAEFFLQQKRDVPLQLPHLIRHHSLSLDKHHFIPLPQPRKSFEFDRPLIVQPAVKCPKLADIQNRKHSLNESKLSLIYGKSHLKPRK